MKPPPFTVAVALIFICGSILSATAEDHDDIFSNLFMFETYDTPEKIHKVGSIFNMQTTYNQSKSNDKLRLTSGYLKQLVMIDYLGGGIPIFKAKTSGAEEMLPCDQLKIRRVELKSPIDCKPVAAHIIDNSFHSTGSIDRNGFDKRFVRQSAYSMKSRFQHNFGTKLNIELILYPLQQDFVQKEVKLRGEECNVRDANFFENNMNLGHYFHFRHIGENYKSSFDCTGHSFLSVNKTKTLARMSNDLYPEYIDEVDFLVRQSKENGYLFSLNNVECKVDESSPGSMNMNFTISQRKWFPYLAVRHNIETSPYRLLSSNSTIEQVLHSEFGDPSYYNTTVDLNFFNAFIDPLNFILTQSFENKGPVTIETTKLTTLGKVFLLVSFNSYERLAKTLKYYELQKEDLKGLFELRYVDLGGETVRIEFDIAKQKLTDTFGKLLKTFEVKEKVPPKKKEETNKV